MKGLKGSKIIEKIGCKRIIVLLIILIILLSITTISFIIQATQSNKVESIVYKENSTIGYNVYLKKNDFFEQEYLEEGKQYIASLIKYVNTHFKYELNSSKNNEDFEYKYKILAEVNVEDLSNQNSIYKFTEELIKEQQVSIKNTSKLIINEDVEIDYNKYNNIINRFIQVYNLNDIKPTLTISMYVEVNGITRNIGTPVASLVIPLTQKTIAIDIESNTVNASDISVYKKIANKDKLYLAILTFTLTIMISIELYIFVNDTKDEQTIYKMKIKKIMSNYDSYIQKIEDDFDYGEYQKIRIKSFEDLLQIRDTISEPILMKEMEMETNFLIPSKENVLYIYTLKVEGLKNGGKHNIIKEKAKV